MGREDSRAAKPGPPASIKPGPHPVNRQKENGDMFKINDEVYHAQYDRKQRYIVCPDCMGKRFLTVIMGDDSRVTIDCVGCTRGAYEGPHGNIETWDYEATVTKRKITGMEVNLQKTEYKSHIFCDENGSSYFTLKSEDMFSTEAEATVRAKELKAEAEKEEAKRLTQKHDRNRSWAWNASYHRKGVRDAERNLAHHTAQLTRASVHVKEDKAVK